MTEPDSKMKEDQKKTLWIIWIAINGFIVFLPAIAHFARSNQDLATSPVFLETFIPVLVGFSVLGTIFIFAYSRFAASKAPYMTFCIIRWALAESIGIYGFVIYFMGGSLTVLAGFIVWSLVLNLIHSPTHANYEKYLVARDDR